MSAFQTDTMRIITIGSAPKGIRALVGRKKGERKLSTQSFLFDKNKWTTSQARKWVTDHGYTIKGAPMSGDKAMHLCRIPLTKQEAPTDDEKQFELIIEAMASTPDVDRGNDVVKPTAFARTMPEFMQNPVMMFNHNAMATIGRILEYKIDENGLWVRGGILPTETGKEVAMLIRGDVVKSMSFRYSIVDWTQGEEGAANELNEVDVYEIGPVSIPMNPAALIEQAKAKNITLNKLIVPVGIGEQTKGVTTMDPKEVQNIVDASLTPVKGDIDKHGVTVGEVQKAVDGVAKKQKEIEDALGDKNKTDAEL
jgi:HK97 family phage prohead protease